MPLRYQAPRGMGRWGAAGSPTLGVYEAADRWKNPENLRRVAARPVYGRRGLP